MKFRAYPKIHRYGKEETEGILDNKVTIQEKIDGANCSMWLDDGVVRCGTRTRELPLDESFNGFQETVNANPLIAEWLKNNPSCRLYAEWLVKHTVTYPNEAYRKIYLYDIYDVDGDTNYEQDYVEKVAKELNLEYPVVFARDKIMTEEEIKEFVGKSNVGVNGEGVVIKNTNFRNKFGDHCYAKIVHQKFKESNAIVFGGNNKHSDTYNEMYIVNKYCTLGRVQKIMMKLQSETDHKIDMAETPKIASICYHDMITEDIWEMISKINKIDFQALRRLSYKKFIQLYHDSLNNTLSIADTKEK